MPCGKAYRMFLRSRNRLSYIFRQRRYLLCFSRLIPRNNHIIFLPCLHDSFPGDCWKYPPRHIPGRSHSDKRPLFGTGILPGRHILFLPTAGRCSFSSSLHRRCQCRLQTALWLSGWQIQSAVRQRKCQIHQRSAPIPFFAVLPTDVWLCQSSAPHPHH